MGSLLLRLAASVQARFVVAEELLREHREVVLVSQGGQKQAERNICAN